MKADGCLSTRDGADAVNNLLVFLVFWDVFGAQRGGPDGGRGV
jgi:hypothetical protein